ncbi:FtsX-like permease family protein [Flavihumibacter sp. R14]|nr:FtsX-like permease family protein [Flavihumibacter soli]
MLRNYFKIAIAVLKRRKFFTFISLFGISFTLTILMVATAYIDKLVNDPYPDAKRDRSLYVNKLEQKMKDGRQSGPLSFYFLDHYAGSLKIPAKVAISSMSRATNTYVNNKKIVINYKYVNSDYWDVLEYDFVEGKPFSKQQIANGEHVTVISEDTKKEYFGETGSVVGKYIEADNVKYRINGVVKNVPVTAYQFFADIYLPYTVSKTDYKDKAYHGEYIAILLAKNEADVPAMRKEYEQMISKVPLPNKDITKMYSHANSYLVSYVNVGSEDTSGIAYVITAIGLFALLVMLLPTLNLVNINITRIMERSSEIGVRKAFGASSRTLVYQFIVENLILTLIGGLIGVLLTFIVIRVLNNAQLIDNLYLTINFTVLLYALAICVFFGLFSGVYPAWRMSKLNVVTALRQNN